MNAVRKVVHSCALVRHCKSIFWPSVVGEDIPEEKEMQMNLVTGALTVHSAFRAVTNHIEWAVNGVVGEPQRFRWREYEGLPGLVKATVHWDAEPGSAVRIASQLRGWTDLRFEITEDATAVHPGTITMHTPRLGLFTAEMNHAGLVAVSADRLEALLSSHADDLAGLTRAIQHALGTPWDEELEPYRRGDTIVTAPALFAVS